MSEKTIEGKLHSYIRDAHAMEENVLRMLDSMISNTGDPTIREQLEHHKSETEQHVDLLSKRLDALGLEGTSAVKDAPAILGAVAKGLGDSMRSDKPGKNARDGYITEAMEIAAYELLERLATRAGDTETAEVARRIRQDEISMREKIEKNWDRVLDLTLEEEGVEV